MKNKNMVAIAVPFVFLAIIIPFIFYRCLLASCTKLVYQTRGRYYADRDAAGGFEMQAPGAAAAAGPPPPPGLAYVGHFGPGQIYGA